MESKSSLPIENLAYKALFESSPEGLGLFALDGELLSANATFVAAFGETTSEALTKMRVRLPAVEASAGLPPEAPVRRELCVHKADGTLVSVALRTALLRGDDGAPRLVMATVEARAALPDRPGSDVRPSAVLDSMDAMVVATDRVGRVTFVNRATERMLGYRPDELVGKMNAGIFHDPAEIVARSAVLSRELGIHVQPGFQTLVAKALRGAADEHEWTCIRKDGSRLPLLMRFAAQRNDDGEAVGFVGVGTDVSDKKRHEKLLLHTMQAAEEAVRAKALLAASMSHEIRTPLNGVLGTVDELLTTPLSFGQRMMVETIQNSADELLASVGELLDFSDLEGGLVDLGSHRFDLRACVNEAINLLLPLAARKGLDIGPSFAADVPEAVIGDPERLRRVLTCLLSNGVKFTPAGRVTIEVATDGDNTLRFRVRDTGPGMPPERVLDLFRPARTRGDGTEIQEQRRAGLGLLLARRLVERMSGSFWVESTEGEGSTFTFTLPAPAAPRPSSRVAPSSSRGSALHPSDILPASIEAVSAVRARAEPSLARRFLDAPPEMKMGLAAPAPRPAAPEPRLRFDGLRVLLAEDNPINRDVLLRVLARLGARTSVVGTGYEVLCALEVDPYDVIVMDVQMPDMDGIEAARHVRERPGPQPRIIAITANTLPGMRDRCFAAGMDDYLPKPVQIDTLAASLDRALEMSRMDPMSGARPPGETILDEGRLASMRQLFDEPEGFAELVDQQISDASRLVTQMRTCLRNADFAALERAAHSLKATSAMFGATRLSAACAALESAASSGQDATVQQLLERVEEEESSARAALLRRVYEHLLKEVSACA